MSDPLSDIVQLLSPQADFSKLVEASGPWRVSRAEAGRPFYCVMLSGECRLETPGSDELCLQAGDFLMIPQAQSFSMAAGDLPTAACRETTPIRQPDGRFRLGPPETPTTARLLIGYCWFRSPDAALLLSLLPRVVHVRSDARLTSLVQLIGDETVACRPGREAILARLLEVTLIEALRTTPDTTPPPGLLRGLRDVRISVAIHRMHADPARPWTVHDLAREAGLSRTVFFERFRSLVGRSPMEHLTLWRMALAKRRLLSRQPLDEVAASVGYGSASAFATAFRRAVGLTPGRFVQAIREPDGWTGGA